MKKRFEDILSKLIVGGALVIIGYMTYFVSETIIMHKLSEMVRVEQSFEEYTPNEDDNIRSLNEFTQEEIDLFGGVCID